MASGFTDIGAIDLDVSDVPDAPDAPDVPDVPDVPAVPDVSKVVPYKYPECAKKDAGCEDERRGSQHDDFRNDKLKMHKPNIGYRVALIERTYVTSFYSKDHDPDAPQDLKKCPGWIDLGTRGCPIPGGAVLAGASKRSHAMRLAIIDLRYEHETVELSLPFPVEPLSMVYDDDTEVLTIAGGTGFGDEVHTLGKQIWQIKLFDKASEWHQMPLLKQGVYDPVLFSNRGVIFIVGGYTKPKHVDATTRCLKLPIGGGWQDIGNLPEPLKDPGHRGGVLWTDTNPAERVMIVFTDDEALHCDSSEDEWVRHNHGKNLENCTPVLGSDGNVYVHLKYIDDGKEKYDVGVYDPKSHELMYMKDQDFMGDYPHVFIPGYFLAPIL